MSNRSAIIYRGRVDWTLDQDAPQTLDITAPDFQSADEGQQYLLSIVNGSATVDLDVRIGSMIRAFGSDSTTHVAQACTMTAATDVIACTGHGFKIGQAVEFSATTGGVIVAGTVYYVIADGFGANAFKVSATREGSTVNLDASDAAAANTVIVADEFAELDTMAVPAFVAAVDTAPGAPVQGVVSSLISGWPNGERGRLILFKSAATAAAFSAFVEVRRA